MMPREEQIEEIIALKTAYSSDYYDIEDMIEGLSKETKTLINSYLKYLVGSDYTGSQQLLDYLSEISYMSNSFTSMITVLSNIDFDLEKRKRFTLTDDDYYSHELANISKNLKKLQVALKLLGQKKHRRKEFQLLKKFLNDITMNRSIMQS